MSTELDEDEPYSDGTTAAAAHPAAGSVRSFAVHVVGGPSAPNAFTASAGRCSIGSHPSNDLVLGDPTVSRFHAELVVDRGRVRLRDLGSRNGTAIDGIEVTDGFVREGSHLRLGDTILRCEAGASPIHIPISSAHAFGGLVGDSIAMRAVFAVLERAARADATVLLHGETGTGKEAAAAAIHEASARRDRPFVVVDCGSIPPTLLDSELFGHERGAFTGAAQRRIGAFEEAHGGTLFLDEIGELPLDLQPKLLRVLEQRSVRRIGTNTAVPIDIRVIAATNRDLRHEVNEGRFRSDLYFRLAVVQVTMPSLRTRPDDIPALVRQILARLGATPEMIGSLAGSMLPRLQGAAWPGNVRELRNYLERCLVFEQPLPLGDAGVAAPVPSATDDATGRAAAAGVSYDEARAQALARFEQSYITALLARHDGKVANAAREAGVDRVYLYRLMRRHGISK